jgi:hypothetical protein
MKSPSNQGEMIIDQYAKPRIVGVSKNFFGYLN